MEQALFHGAWDCSPWTPAGANLVSVQFKCVKVGMKVSSNDALD